MRSGGAVAMVSANDVRGVTGCSLQPSEFFREELGANVDCRAHKTLTAARHAVAPRARILRDQAVSTKQADPAAHLPGSPAPFRGVFGSRTVQPFGHLTIAKAAHGVFTPQHGLKQGLIVT